MIQSEKKINTREDIKREETEQDPYLELLNLLDVLLEKADTKLEN